MPPPAGHQIPAELIPGGGRNGAPQANNINTGTYGDVYQSHSPTDMTNTNSNAPWASSSAPGPDHSQQPEDRAGRAHDVSQGPRDKSTPRDPSRSNGQVNTKAPTNTSRVCRKCGEPLLGQFVRALGGTFHLECFQCNVSTGSCYATLRLK